jgi:hypothetical protein
MKSYAHLIRWLTLAALMDWLIVRTLARAAIFMPKPPAVLAAYQVITKAGQMASILAAILAVTVIAWLAWDGRRASRGLPSLALANLLFLGLAFQVIPASGWLLVIDQLLLSLLILWIGITGIRGADRIEEKLAISLPTLALLAGALYQSVPSVFTALRLPGPPPLLNMLFNLGELFVVLSGFGLWWAYGRRSVHRRADYFLAALPALAFTAMHWANPSMAGILAIWSSGLTLYLPWPLYALSLYLAGATVLIALRRDSPVGWAILLLAAGGYTPQLSTQIFLGLIGLSLLCAANEKLILQSEPNPVPERPQPDPSLPYHPRHSEA